MRYCGVVIVSLVGLVQAPSLVGCPVPVKAPLPQEEKPKYRLTLYSNFSKYERGHETLGKTYLYFYFRNNTDSIAYVKEMPCYLNALVECTTLWYVFRFEDDTIVVHDKPPPYASTGDPFDETLRRPLTLPETSSVRGHQTISGLCLSNPRLRDTIRECDKFSVTLVVEPLKLKSNTIYFNGMKQPEKEPDALEDLKLWRKRLKEEEAEKKRRIEEEDERRKRWLDSDR